MGDVGYLDDEGQFWFCGRKGHRVITADRTLFTIPCEQIFNVHPKIYRSALVGMGPGGNQVPVIVAEPWPEYWPTHSRNRKKLIDELLELGRKNDLTSSVERIYLMKALPVDIRHNSKIFREKLAVWVSKQNG
jgi:acyl-coenzyme A synthetase/AMP-(fatty) acid ligase